MKSRKFCIIIVAVMFLSILTLSAQKSITLKVTLNKHYKQKNIIDLCVTVFNNTDSAILFYKPTIDDICNGLVYVNIQNSHSKEITYSLFPCIYKADLGVIFLNKSNSVDILANTSYTTSFKFSLKKVSKKFISKPFEMLVYFNYVNGNFTSGENKNIFKGFIVSNELLIDP